MELSTQKIAQILGISERYVNMCAQKEGWQAATYRGKGGKRLWQLESLSLEWQNRIQSFYALQDPLEIALLEKQQQIEKEATLLREKAVQESLAKFNSLSEYSKKVAHAKLHILLVVEKFASVNNCNISQARSKFVSLYKENTIEFEDNIKTYIPRISISSLINWDKENRNGGISALADKRAKSGRRGWSKQNSELKQYIKAFLFDHPHASSQLIKDAIKVHFRLDIAQRTIQDWIAAVKADNKQILNANKNRDKWRSTTQFAIGSASEDVVRLNQRWEVDSTPTDIILSDGKRHAIIGVIDVYSRRAILHISYTSTSQAIAACLRKAIISWGIPDEIVTDNGQDYISNHTKNYLKNLGIKHRIAPPGTPEAKPHIERFFETFSHGLFSLQPGFIGHNVAMRKDIEAQNKFTQRLCKRSKNKENNDPFTMYTSQKELQAFCDSWTENHYHQNSHSGLNKLSPWQKYLTWKQPIKRVTDERALDVLLAPQAGIRVIGKKGIRLDNGLYFSTNFVGWEGEQVKVFWDDADASAVYVFSMDDEFIAHARNLEIISGIERAEASKVAKRAQRKFISKGTKELRRLSKKYDTKFAVNEILEDKAKEADKLYSLPKPEVVYTNSALDEAGKAIRSNEIPAPQGLTPLQQATLDRLANEENSQVISLPENPSSRFRRWQEVNNRFNQGLPMTEHEANWHQTYQQTSEYRAQLIIQENFGQQAQQAGCGS